MIDTFFGFKAHQTRVFTETGKQIPVTVISASPCVITRVLDTEALRGYQLGIGTRKHLKKPVEGSLKKAGIEKKPRFLRQVRVENLDETLTVGGEVTPSQVFAVGDAVAVTGVSRGKGFAGVVKRHGFHGGPKTHGQSDRWRAPGSIGSGTTPGRVYKGKKMAGRAGNDTVTTKGLSIVAIDDVAQTITVKGLVAGAKNGLVRIVKKG